MEHHRLLFYLGRSRFSFELRFSRFFLWTFFIVSLIFLVAGSFCWARQGELQKEVDFLQEQNQVLQQEKNRFEGFLEEDCKQLREFHKKIEPLYAIVTDRAPEQLESNFTFTRSNSEQNNILAEEMEVVQRKLSLVLNAVRNRAELLYKVPNGWPLPVSVPKRVGSAYGKRFSPFSKDFKLHTGVDLPAPPDTKIFCTGNGIVIFSGYKKSYGYTVIVDHGYGFSTLYAHCAQLMVTEGEPVKKGQSIALVGISGDTTGFHLHYEVRIGQKAVDPHPFLMITP